MNLIKPPKLNKGDIIATVSTSWGVAGEPDVMWRYNIGKERLENMGLVVVSAPNAMKGEKYLAENPQARAEDIMWAFENKNINAEFLSPEQLADFVDWLGTIGALQMLKGMLIGKLCEYTAFDDHKEALLRIVKDKYNLADLPIVANLNFGHTSPMCILPYGAMAEIDCDNQSFSILESGVI